MWLIENKLKLVDWDDRQFVNGIISHLPYDLQRTVFEFYMGIDGKRQRNIWLRETKSELVKRLPISFERLNLNCDEDEIKIEAKKHSRAVLDILGSVGHDYPELYPMLEGYVKPLGIKPPSLDAYSLEGCVSRLKDISWWMRRLRRFHMRAIETVFHAIGQVNRKLGIYCSHHTVNVRINQKHKSREWLEATIATNDEGQSFSLLELSQMGVADPKIRKTELMVRARGFEDLSLELNHVSAFLTITCPSKYHRCYAKTGQKNPNWQGYTPLDGQAYLNRLWVKVRSKLQREGVRFYGFRVAEPQHDGTPHWHLLLFVEPDKYDVMVQVMRTYALQEDGDEHGAQQHRFTEVKIDPEKGSATGYIAKYISKNIDGENLDSGIYGEDPKEAAVRVEAWASCWGIRQFQQLGGCSVTVWRELRRLKALTDDADPKLVDILNAADDGDWMRYTQLMGGVFCPRAKQAFRPHYDITFDKQTGEINHSQYSANELIQSLKGIVADGKVFISRIFRWKLETKYTFVDYAKLHPAAAPNLEFCE
ncbi:replication endonuclease [Motilimonas cestriensis]|uniref:Replication endonuclease n=1 Tax=Motilimonas cestriensis TaxID=2742685 RepID=A0ABS8W737_9GAMM|nr:replication endonuclease [Motilimonas cestriensis]MCE2594796.1 replication endonuclease [Motilimonas cestriensis]